jgi:replicative DNA helicase
MSDVRSLTRRWRETRHTPPPPPYPLGPAFEAIEFEPGTVGVLLGGPGSGKSCLALQWSAAAVQGDPALVVAYVCVEITEARLMNRLVAHLGQVDYRRVRKRLLTAEDDPKVDAALGRLEAIGDRLHLLTEPPFTLDHIVRQVNEIAPAPQLIVLDYLQRFRVPVEVTRRPDPREMVSDLMTECRHLAAQGASVLLLSAANRSGRNDYGRLTITSGRESSEVEYAADSIWALQAGPTDGERVLETLKARDGELATIPLVFDGRHQTFRAGEPPSPPQTQGEKPDWVRDYERRAKQ